MDTKNLSLGTKVPTGYSLAAIFITLLFVGLVMSTTTHPVTREVVRKSNCQNNLKQLAAALQMYLTDYDGVLPSSALRLSKNSSEWNAGESAAFCAQRGKIPPDKAPAQSDISWVSVLFPYFKNQDIIWCPSDADKNYSDVNTLADRASFVSYIYRPAVDRAWFDAPHPVDPNKPNSSVKIMHFRRITDYKCAADQMIFFEKKGWHWGDAEKGWSDTPAPVSLNTAFLDGHVRAVRLKNACNIPVPNTVSALKTSIESPGEPLWFNCKGDGENRGTGKGKWYDPRVYYDDLQ